MTTFAFFPGMRQILNVWVYDTNLQNQPQIESSKKKYLEKETLQLNLPKTHIQLDHDYALRDISIDGNIRIVHIPNNTLIESNGTIATNGTSTQHKENGLSNGNHQMSEEDFAALTQDTDKRPHKTRNQKQNVQKMAMSLKEQPSKFELLNIEIPQNMEVSKKKLILKGNKLLPVKPNVLVNGNQTEKNSNVSMTNGKSSAVPLLPNNSFVIDSKNTVPTLQLISQEQRIENGHLFSNEDEFEFERRDVLADILKYVIS